MNILILSCGTRNNIVRYFKRELTGIGEVLAADCSPLAPALYDADRFFVIPRIDDAGYLDVLLSICEENQVKAVLSLIDPELNLLAENRQRFLDIGTEVIISDPNIVYLCYNKYAMYEYLVRTGFKTIRSYKDKDAFYKDVESGRIKYPAFVKPVNGSASNNARKVSSKEEIELLCLHCDNLMIQEYINGVEYGADVYIDLISFKPVAIFTKEKIKMRAGETDKSVSVKDDKLFRLIEDFVRRTPFRGIIDIDLYKVDGEYCIIEVNPRFGGGYPHAYECGVNVPKMIINNINGVENVADIGGYEEGVYMMKHSEIKIIRPEDLKASL